MPDGGADPSLRFAVLGPVRAWRPAGELDLGRPQQRALLAVLLLSPGRPVSRHELLDAVWGEDLTDSASAALRTLVARLRKTLISAGGECPLVSAPGGYVLNIASGSLDLDSFQQLTGDAAQARTSGRLDHAGRLLDQALGLVQGNPLASVPGPFAQHQRERLAALVLGVEQQRLEIGLERGRHEDVLGTAAELVARHPLHERLREFLMLALYRCGRQADALSTYHDARRLLAAELGVDPTPALQRLYEQILHADPTLDASAAGPPVERSALPSAPSPSEPAPTASAAAPWTAPALLPRALTSFVARPRPWRGLSEACDPASRGRPVVLAGPAGSGKTSLIAAWSRAMADRFPDGVLYGDLGGFSVTGPPDTGTLLAGFLRATGVPEQEVPAGTDARAALFRDRIHARRLLLVLDNAACAEDVHRFLPAPGAATAVVCSRHTLEGLIATHEARFVPVGHFTPDAAHELLRLRLGDARTLADPRAARRLAELCDHLPLALSIATARLATRPTWTLADLVAELETDQGGLIALGAATRRSVEHELDLSRRLLSPQADRLLALLSLHPGTAFDPWSAAALLNQPLADARAALEELAALHLLDETTPGCYQAHDLIRAYCVTLAERDVTTATRDQAVNRLTEYYIAAGHAYANIGSAGGYAKKPDIPPPGGLPPMPSSAAGLAWFRREEPTISQLILSHADTGRHRQACRLAENTGDLYYQSGTLIRQWEHVTSRALAAAKAADDPSWAYLHSLHAIALHSRGHGNEALHQAERAAALAATTDDATLRFVTRARWANVLTANGHQRQALEQLQICVVEAERLGSDRGLAQALNNLANTWLTLDEPAQALEPVQRSLQLLAGRTDDPHLAISMQTHAETLAQLGHTHEALAQSHRALQLGTAQGNQRLESYCAQFIGTQLHQLGRRAEARQLWQQALDHATEHGRPTEQLQALLDQG